MKSVIQRTTIRVNLGSVFLTMKLAIKNRLKLPVIVRTMIHVLLRRSLQQRLPLARGWQGLGSRETDSLTLQNPTGNGKLN